MMKPLFTLLFLVSVHFVNAQLGVKYDDAKIIFTNGKSRSGLAETSMGDKFLYFKTSKDATPEKIDVTELATIVYIDGDKKSEYDRIKVYLGWKQERISDFTWMEVVERGIATLYVQRSSMSSSAMQPQNKAGFLDYFLIRKDEPAAKMIANISSLNNNQTFRAKAPLYFADYPELAEKIKSKVYTWKELIPVVQEYNKWAVKKVPNKK